MNHFTSIQCKGISVCCIWPTNRGHYWAEGLSDPIKRGVEYILHSPSWLFGFWCLLHWPVLWTMPFTNPLCRFSSTLSLITNGGPYGVNGVINQSAYACRLYSASAIGSESVLVGVTGEYFEPCHKPIRCVYFLRSCPWSQNGGPYGQWVFKSNQNRCWVYSASTID